MRVQLSLQRDVLMVASRDKTDLHEDHAGGGLAYVIVRKPDQKQGSLASKLQADEQDKRDSRCENALIPSK